MTNIRVYCPMSHNEDRRGMEAEMRCIVCEKLYTGAPGIISARPYIAPEVKQPNMRCKHLQPGETSCQMHNIHCLYPKCMVLFPEDGSEQ